MVCAVLKFSIDPKTLETKNSHFIRNLIAIGLLTYRPIVSVASVADYEVTAGSVVAVTTTTSSDAVTTSTSVAVTTNIPTSTPIFQLDLSPPILVMLLTRFGLDFIVPESNGDAFEVLVALREMVKICSYCDDSTGWSGTTHNGQFSIQGRGTVWILC